MVEATKAMLSHPDMLKVLTTMFVTTFQDPEVQKGVAVLLEECFHKVLLDKETIDKSRIFIYNLMTMELEDTKGKKSSLLDLMLSKAVARKSGQKEDIRAIIESKLKPAQDTSIEDILANITQVAITPPLSNPSPSQDNNSSGDNKPPS